MKTGSRRCPRIFPPRPATGNLAGSIEFNKAQLEIQVLRSRAATPEQIDFPCVEQVALLRRGLRQHQPETVALVTRLPPSKLNAAQWLADNRSAWGIENGLHLPLDVSHLDGPCRVRLPKSMRVAGMLRRFSNSLFMHGRTRQTNPECKTTTDFFTAMNAEPHCYAIRCLHAHQPSFQTAS